MRTELERRLRSELQRDAFQAPRNPSLPALEDHGVPHSRPPDRPWSVVLAVAASVVLVIGLFSLTGRSDEPASNAPAPSMPETTPAAPPVEPTSGLGWIPSNPYAGFTISSMTATATDGVMRPILGNTGSIDSEIWWSVQGESTLIGEGDAVELANGQRAYLGAPQETTISVAWQANPEQIVEIVSSDETFDYADLIELANTFRPATPSDITDVQAAIADEVRATYTPGRSSEVDGTLVELFLLDTRPAAMCIATDRCETAVGSDRYETDETVLIFNFEQIDGAMDVYGFLAGEVEALEPSDGITVTTTPDNDGIWIHARRRASSEQGNVAVIGASPSLHELLSFSV